MIGLIDSFDVEYNGTENEALFKLVCDSAAELSSLTHYDNIKIRIGSECTDIATGDKYLKSSSAWVLQPQSMFANVYTKAEVDSMLNIQYQTMLYYHTVQTYTTGTITFYAFEGFVGSLTIYGNGQQTGTPTPDNPVMPEFVGVRTGNLFDKSAQAGQIYVTDSEMRYGVEIPVSSGTYTVSGGTSVSFAKTKIGDVYGEAISLNAAQVFTLASDGYMLIYSSSQAAYDAAKDGIIINLGSTALPYEPFGWAEKITCAGQTTPVYLGQTQTVRRIRKLVLDGTENWSTEPIAGIRRAYMQLPDQVIPNIGLSTHYIVQSGKYDDGYCNVNATGLLFIYSSVYASGTAAFKAYLAAQYAAGTPVTVWYVLATPETGTINEPLAKIDDYADILHLTDTLAPIPTVDGENTLTVDTTLPPSKIEISGER